MTDLSNTPRFHSSQETPAQAAMDITVKLIVGCIVGTMFVMGPSLARAAYLYYVGAV